MEIIYRQDKDRWITGDRHVRPLIRRIIRGRRTQFSGMEMVVRNFLKGLDMKGIKYSYNRPTFFLNRKSSIISFGLGLNGVSGIYKKTPVIAAIGFPYPGEIPDLCERYNIKKYLQHSRWVLDFVKSAKLYDEVIFDLWPAGIDTDEWACGNNMKDKKIDVLIYNKIHWDKQERARDLVAPIVNHLSSRGLSHTEIRYGNYTRAEYKKFLSLSKVMVFLSEHESQGLAYQECMSCNVPVMAWDQGYFLDPIRYSYNRPILSATSVPFFDERCGETFKDAIDFTDKFAGFYDKAIRGIFRPRDYILENLTIEKSTDRMLAIYEAV